MKTWMEFYDRIVFQGTKNQLLNQHFMVLFFHLNESFFYYFKSIVLFLLNTINVSEIVVLWCHLRILVLKKTRIRLYPSDFVNFSKSSLTGNRNNLEIRSLKFHISIWWRRRGITTFVWIWICLRYTSRAFWKFYPILRADS